MANIIAIIDDAKIRSQVESYLREIDEEGNLVRFFTTGYEFEQTYLAPKKALPTHPLNKLSGWEKFTAEQIESSLTIELGAESALPHPTLRLRYNLRSKKIEMIDPLVDANQEIFGSFPDEAQRQADFIGGQVLLEFKSDWEQFIKRAITTRTQTMVPIKVMGKSKIAWCKAHGSPLGPDLITLEISDVTGLYREQIQTELARRNSHDEESEELKLFSEIDLIIFKIDCISGKPPAWVGQIWQRLFDGGYFPKERLIRFVALKYEDDGVSKLDMIQPRLDDLIYLPLDRLIFLQKLEIILSLPKKTKPSFLFSQEANQTIEVSKLSKLERLSDLGLAIRNPVPLMPGLIGHFFVNIPGENSPLEIWGKVLRSVPHPEREGEFLVYFFFFAPRRAMMSEIKKYLPKVGRFQPFLKDDRNAFLYNPDDIFTTDEERKIRGVAILTVDDELGENLRSHLTKDIDQIRVVAESSLAGFFNQYLGANGKLTGPKVAASENDFGGPSLELNIKSSSMELIKPTNPPSEEQPYLGKSAVESFATSKGWLQPFYAIPGNDELMSELAAMSNTGIKVTRILEAQDFSGLTKVLRVSFSPGAISGEVTVELIPPSSDDLKVDPSKERLSQLDLIVVDRRMVVSGDVNGFMAALQARAERANAIAPGKKLKFIFLVSKEDQLQPREYAAHEIVGLFSQPLEQRQVSAIIAAALDSMFSVYTFANWGWTSTLLSVHVAKEIELESMSEFGAELRHSRPIMPGTVLFLRGGLFDNAPNQCLAARFYHCEEHPEYKGEYRCSTTYFGINDAFMKYARRWFRETYAQSKQAD